MASRFLFEFFELIFLAAAVASQADQSPPLETINIASKTFAVDPADIVLGGTTVSAGGPAVTIGGAIVFEDRHEDLFVNGVEVLTGSPDIAKTTFGSLSQLRSQNYSISASNGSSHTTATDTPSSLFHLASSNVSESGSSTELLQHEPGGRTASSAFSPAASNTTTPSNGTTTASSGFSTNNPNAAATAKKEMSRGSVVTWLSPKLSNLLSSPSSVTNSSSNSSQTTASDTPSSATGLGLAEISTSSNQTFNSSASAFSKKLTIAATHSNVTSLGSQTSALVANHWNKASSTISSAFTNVEINTTTANAQILIPTASLSPTNAAAIAGGMAIGEGLALLYSQGHANSDLAASKTIFINSIETLKSDLETLRTDLGGSESSCSGSRSRNRHKKRSIFSDLLTTINNAVCSLTKTQVDLDAVPPDLDEIEADWVEIEGLADELTEEEKEEEEEEEEEKETQSAEEEKVSKTSSTLSSKTSSTRPWETSSTRLSSTGDSIAPCYTGLIQPYPADYYESAAADDAVFAVAAAALYAGMGDSGGGASGTSDNSTSTISRSVAKASSKAIPDVSSQTTDGYWLNGVWIPGGGGKNGIANSTMSTNTSTISRSATFALESPPDITTTTGANLPHKNNKVKPLSEYIQTVHSAQVSTNEMRPLAASISEASASRASASRASASRASASKASALNASASSASVAAASAAKASAAAASAAKASAAKASAAKASAAKASAAKASAAAASAAKASAAKASAARVSASKVSASAASASVASASSVSASAASAAAASFPSQVSSNQGSSSLCKSIGNASCITAYSLYNPLYYYTQYTSYVHTTGGFDGEWLGWGCAAMFTCDTSADYAKGMGGQEILNAFEYLYAQDGVEICGSIYMDNGCHLTVNACASCTSSIPCEALPENEQPPDGGVPCVYSNGTTWPSTSDPSGSTCRRDLQGRAVC